MRRKVEGEKRQVNRELHARNKGLKGEKTKETVHKYREMYVRGGGGKQRRKRRRQGG